MFTDEQVAYAVENCNVSWKEQAVKTAERYLEYSSYKREELITQLEFEGFSKEEAEYAADQSGLK
ncbi:MAG: Ltp family lipoprotein [Clostridia bacterium]|nr:Ltp family lipoprotein [Clostridia bacterium]